jgi:cysteine desulfurase
MRIYLDHAATTPLRPEVRDAMESAAGTGWANPSSPHTEGRRARALLDQARHRVRTLLGAPGHQVIFTRGGTESDNLAVLGRAHAGVPLISVLEHSAVRAPALWLRQQAAPEALAPFTFGVSPSGEVLLDDATEGAPPSIGVLSLQLVNSETGLTPDLSRARGWAHARGIPLHVDAVQAPGRVPLPTGDALPELLTLSGHKLGGPRGVGVLVVAPGVALNPTLHGGRQEGGLRPGTEDVVGAVGFSEALALALAEADGADHGAQTPSEPTRLGALRDALEDALVRAAPGSWIHAGEGPRAPHILGLQIPGITTELLLAALDLEGIAAASGSACRTGLPGPRPALEALHGDAAHEGAPLRLSLGWNTTSAHIEEAVDRITRVLSRIPASHPTKRTAAP